MSRIITDISHWQGEVDFEKMKYAGASAVIFKASQYYEDKNYKTNVAGVKGILPYAAYHYYDNTIDPNNQAQKFASVLGGTEKFIIADYEDRLPGNHSGWKKLYTFLVKLQELVPNKKIVIYSTYYYWKENSPQAFWQKSSLDWFGQFKFWYAAYNTRTWEEQLIPKPWTPEETIMWQYTRKGDGEMYGVSSEEIDLNRWTGTEEEFTEYFGEVEPPTPPTEPPVEPPTGETLYRKTEYNGAFCFTPLEVAPPEPPEPAEMQLVRKEGKDVCIINQSASTETNTIHLDFIEGATVLVLPVPEFRIMMMPDGTTHEVPNWKSIEERDRIQKLWRFLIIQKVVKSNGNEKELHTSWTASGSKGNWDTMGSYILLEYLKEIGAPEPPPEPPPPPPPPAPVIEFPREFVIPDDDYTYYQLKHDWENPNWGEDGSTRQDTKTSPGKWEALPETVILHKELWIHVPTKWRQFLRDCARLDSSDKNAEFQEMAYRSLVDDHRAFTDLGHYRTYEDYDWKVSLSTGGNIVRGYRNGTNLIVDCFDITKDPPNAEDVRDEFWRIHYATQIWPREYRNADKTFTTCRFDDGTYKVTHFPQGRSAAGEKTGTTFPLWGQGDTKIIESRHIANELKLGDVVKIVNLARDH